MKDEIKRRIIWSLVLLLTFLSLLGVEYTELSSQINQDNPNPDKGVEEFQDEVTSTMKPEDPLSEVNPYESSNDTGDIVNYTCGEDYTFSLLVDGSKDDIATLSYIGKTSIGESQEIHFFSGNDGHATVGLIRDESSWTLTTAVQAYTSPIEGTIISTKSCDVYGNIYTSCTVDCGNGQIQLSNGKVESKVNIPEKKLILMPNQQ